MTKNVNEIKIYLYIYLSNILLDKQSTIRFSFDVIDIVDNIDNTTKRIEHKIIYFFNNLLNIDIQHNYTSFDDLEENIDYNIYVQLLYFIMKHKKLNNILNPKLGYIEFQYEYFDLKTITDLFKLFKPYNNLNEFIDSELTEDINNILNDIIKFILINKASNDIKDKWMFLIHVNKFNLI